MAESEAVRGNGRSFKSKEELLQEYPAVGRYRVRLLKNGARPEGGAILDIREYIVARDFEGFTRKGVRFRSLGEINMLRDTLAEVAAIAWPEASEVKPPERMTA